MRLKLALVPRLALAFGLMLVCLGLAPVVAQTTAAVPQVLTLDQNRLYTESLYGKAMEAKALAASQTLAGENRKIEADLAVEEADLTQKRTTMTSAAFQTLADAFDAKVEQLRKDQAAKGAVLTAERDAGRTIFFQASVPVLGELMKGLGAYAILNHDAVVLAFDSIDVTDRAIAAVNAKLGDGTAPPSGLRLPAEATTPKLSPAPVPDPAPIPGPAPAVPTP